MPSCILNSTVCMGRLTLWGKDRVLGVMDEMVFPRSRLLLMFWVCWGHRHATERQRRAAWDGRWGRLRG